MHACASEQTPPHTHTVTHTNACMHAHTDTHTHTHTHTHTQMRIEHTVTAWIFALYNLSPSSSTDRV